jgi:hypothetical protein
MCLLVIIIVIRIINNVIWPASTTKYVIQETPTKTGISVILVEETGL